MDNNILAAAVLVEFSGYGANLSADISDAEIAEMADEAMAFLVENDDEYREDHDNVHRPEEGYDILHSAHCTLCNPWDDLKVVRGAFIDIFVTNREEWAAQLAA